MALDVTSQVHVRVAFTIKDDTVPNDPGFSDALFYTQAEFALKTALQIRADATARYVAWKNTPPPVVPVRTPKTIREEAVASIRTAMDSLTVKVAEIQSTDA